MYLCPRCHQELAQKGDANGLFWRCERCGGNAVGFGVVRQHIGETNMAGIWRQVFPVHNQDGRACPTCSRAMTLASVDVGGKGMTLDFCRICEFAWFDAGEYEALPLALKPRVVGGSVYSDLVVDSEGGLEMMRGYEIAEKSRGDKPTPFSIWKSILATPGLPIGMASDGSDRVPWVTYFSSLSIAGVSIAAFFHMQTVVDLYGMIPNQVWRDDGLTFLTSFFLQGSWFHLLTTLFFLLIFGRAVENNLGAWRWLLVLLAADQTGKLLQILCDPESGVPGIGASGAISGIITYFALNFPRARLGMLFNNRYVYWRWTQFPAWLAIFFWIGLQIIFASEQGPGFSYDSVLAHLGGVGAGVSLWFIWRQR